MAPPPGAKAGDAKARPVAGAGGKTAKRGKKSNTGPSGPNGAAAAKGKPSKPAAGPYNPGKPGFNYNLLADDDGNRPDSPDDDDRQYWSGQECPDGTSAATSIGIPDKPFPESVEKVIVPFVKEEEEEEPPLDLDSEFCIILPDGEMMSRSADTQNGGRVPVKPTQGQVKNSQFVDVELGPENEYVFV